MIDKPDEKPRPVSGVAWYSREQWALLRSVASDVHDLEETFDEWIEYASRTFKGIRDTGIDLVKVDVDVDELILWCKKKGCPVDAEARTAFVIHKLKERHEGRDRLYISYGECVRYPMEYSHAS